MSTTPALAGATGNPIWDNLIQILDPSDQIELVMCDGNVHVLKTSIPARRNLRAVRALQELLTRPDVGPIVEQIQAFIGKAQANEATGADIVATIKGTLAGTLAASDEVMDALDQILMDAYGDTLPSPVCDHFELVEVVKALAPFFARPLRGLLSGVRKDVAASKGPGTPTAG